MVGVDNVALECSRVGDEYMGGMGCDGLVSQSQPLAATEAEDMQSCTAEIGHGACADLESNGMSCADAKPLSPYTQRLLGRAFLAFDGYAHSEYEKVLGIQRAINSPKTATIFEKWKRLPTLSDLRGVRARSRPGRVVVPRCRRSGRGP